MPAQILDGKAIAAEIKEKLKKQLEELKTNYGITPNLVAVQVGENLAIAVYVVQQQKNCEALGINYQLKQLAEDTTESQLIEFIQKLNADPAVHGIILLLPLPQTIDARKIQTLILPKKDVEGVHPANMGLIVYGRPRLAPCTALAVMELIKRTGVDVEGKEVTMVGHSDIVGKPVALLLLDQFATTTVCHIATRDVPYHVRNADILIVAVGKPHLIKGEIIKDNAIIIDVGTSRVGDKIVGDVEFDVAKERASFITPVPGGVGPLTVTMLLKNTVEAVKWQLEG